MDAPLLLHSLAEFRQLIFACFDVAGVRRVVEIGSEEATFTRELAAWAEEHDGRVLCVEPEPSPALLELCRASPVLDLVQGRSPAALEGLERAHAYLVDGDHNYATVLGELRAVAPPPGDDAEPFLVFLHDVGWPCGRRDMYYAPETLPPEAVHRFTYAHGVTLGCPQVVKGGHRGEGQFAWAREEGGPANGVLTAVEDFLEGRDDLAFVTVPCIFGLGVVYSKESAAAAPLGQLLASYADNELLDKLEHNRLALYLRVIQLQDDNEKVAHALEDSRLRIRDVEAENRALWARTAELEAEVSRLARQLGNVSDEIATLVGSRAFAVAERLSQVRGRAPGNGPGLSRQRLRAVLDTEQPV